MSDSALTKIGKFWSFLTGHGASLVALAGFIVVSIIATAMGFSDLRMANAGKTSLTLAEAAPIWGITVFVVLTMVAGLNAALGVGMKPVRETPTKNDLLENPNATSKTYKRRIALRILACFFYLFFAFWSVGFGYGFFWKELAGEEFTRNQFSAAIEKVSTSVDAANEALSTVENSVIGAAMTARDRADIEASVGGTCSNRPNSKEGDGPLTRARFAFADRARALRDDVSDRWIGRLTDDRTILQHRITALATNNVPSGVTNADEAALLQKLAIAPRLTSLERERVFTQVFDDARAFTAKANALRASNAPLFAERLETLAGGVGPDPQNPNRADPSRADDPSYCWDTVLTEKLRASAQSLRSLDDMDAPEFEFTEGPKATRAAFFNLAKTISPPWGANADKNVNFGEKEFIALFASIAVDLGIMFLTLIRAMMESKGKKRIARRPQVMRLADIQEANREADHGPKSS
ncbi:hypothetical protein [Hirschia litorea]|uniref:Uncharacterized protein n=1 Tax=Hirschia litorea TaxID=1199156 RepID=A0ABW2IN03_9PROT